ncbi:M48 family metalloprotease [uncultured Sphingomonas sp.]|uniref:M48 family metalloprotease n=1 Tax=uncultured Sphingomonas sp. TaxID=158754 RepID=UPI0035CA7CF7
MPPLLQIPWLSAIAALAVTTSLAAGPAPPDQVAQLETLRAVDLRLATIAYRLTTANAALCRDLSPTPGWAIQSLGQYAPASRAAARQVFGFERPIAVEAVVSGGPAEKAGIRPNDSLVSVDGAALPNGDPVAGTANSITRDAALAQIARKPIDRPLTLELVRGGTARKVAIDAPAGCRSNFEILLTPGMDASSDGVVVQIGVRFFERYGDEAVAAIVAHELSHTILRHRQRLDAAKVDHGLFAELGRNGRLFRATEGAADQLSVSLLYNAGYDPLNAVRFWREHGGDVDGGLFRSRTHPSASARAAAIADEVARIPEGAPRPYVPTVLATRDQPLN